MKQRTLSPAHKAARMPAPRGFWPMRDVPTIAWLALTVAAVLFHRQIPVPRWLMIHLLLLGAVTHAILVWSQYFSFALLRSRATMLDRRLQNLRLVFSNLGAMLVCVGVPAKLWPLTATGAALIIAAVTWHGASILHRLRRSLPGKFGRTVRYYVASAALLVLGAALGAIIARGGAPNLALSHAIINVLGWIGITVAGTVLTLWPTILRTRADERATAAATRALPLLAVGVLVAAGGAALALPAVVAFGLAGYLAGLVLIGATLWRAARQSVPQGFAALSVGAGLAWWIGVVAVLLIGSIAPIVSVCEDGGCATGAEALAELSDLIRAAVPYLAAGFAAQTLVGALSYLVPVVLGGGPAPVRIGTAVFERLGPLRVTIANAALAVCALPVSSVTRVVAASLYLIAMGSFLWFLPIAMRAQRRAKQHNADGVGPPGRPVDPRPGSAAGQAVAGLLTVVLAVAVCMAIAPPQSLRPGTPIGSADASVRTVKVEAANMRFTPSRIEVPVGTRLIVQLSNTDTEQTHDLVFENGAGGARLAPGESETIDVGVITSDLEGWCSIVGHRQMGMTLQVIAVSDAAASAEASEGGSGGPDLPHHGSHDSAGAADGNAIDLMSEPGPGFEPADAVLPALPQAREPVTRRITLTAQEVEREVAPGVTQTLWTYNGTAPGPTLHGRVGDTFVVTLRNDTSMGHSIDFHAGSLAPEEPMRTIAPGESLSYEFTATRSGIWMYHCSTMPMSVHIANGMYGAVVIEPEDLPAVDNSYVLVQGEYYLGELDGGEVDQAKVAAGEPDLVVFNGYAG